MNNSSFLNRIFCAILNKYPFKSNEKVEAAYRNGTIKEFYKEKLNDLESFTERKIRFQP